MWLFRNWLRNPVFKKQKGVKKELDLASFFPPRNHNKEDSLVLIKGLVVTCQFCCLLFNRQQQQHELRDKGAKTRVADPGTFFFKRHPHHPLRAQTYQKKGPWHPANELILLEKSSKIRVQEAAT